MDQSAIPTDRRENRHITSLSLRDPSTSLLDLKVKQSGLAKKKNTGKEITKLSGEHKELKRILKYLWPACRCIVTKNLTSI
jgi:hypothetical protein